MPLYDSIHQKLSACVRSPPLFWQCQDFESAFRKRFVNTGLLQKLFGKFFGFDQNWGGSCASCANFGIAQPLMPRLLTKSQLLQDWSSSLRTKTILSRPGTDVEKGWHRDCQWTALGLIVWSENFKFRQSKAKSSDFYQQSLWAEKGDIRYF